MPDNNVRNELLNLIGKLRNQKKEVQNQLSTIDEQITAVEKTMRLLLPNKQTSISESDQSIIKDLQGKHHIEALTIIAGKNNNNLKVTDAKRLMIQAGLISNPKNALSMLYTEISRSKKFDKISSGNYRLINTQVNMT